MPVRAHMVVFLKRRFLALCLVLAACSGGGPPFEAPPAPGNKAVIWLFRPASIVGAANTDFIGIKGCLLARLRNGDYLPIEVAPGEVTLQHAQNTQMLFVGLEDALTLRVEAGRNYFVEFSPAELVDEARARARIGGMDRVAPVENCTL